MTSNTWLPANTQELADNIYSKAMARLYGWIALGVATTAAAAFVGYQAGILPSIVANFGIWGYLGLLAVWIGSIFALSLLQSKLSHGWLAAAYLGFTALSGIIISGVPAAYGTSQIVTALVAAGAVFGGASLVGITTKKNLSGLGTFCMIGIFGIVAVSIVNIFIGSSMIGWLVSIIALPLFIGLTVWETKQVKEMAQQAAMQNDENAAARVALAGSVGLYVNLLNIFLIILRLLELFNDD